MIIVCINCNKKFDVNSSLIPENGRLLQCNSCNYKWFFKKEIINESILTNKPDHPIKETENSKEINPIDIEHPKTIQLLDASVNDNNIKKETVKNKDKNLDVNKNKKNYNILGKIVVFIISLVALVILMDTFQGPISKILPNFKFVLYNLYETITDIVLFLKNLI